MLYDSFHYYHGAFNFFVLTDIFATPPFGAIFLIAPRTFRVGALRSIVSKSRFWDILYDMDIGHVDSAPNTQSRRAEVVLCQMWRDSVPSTECSIRVICCIVAYKTNPVPD